MAEQINHPELTVKQIDLTEGHISDLIMPDSIKPDSIENSTAVTRQSSHEIDKVSPKIVLATLNAKFFHTSFGLPKHN